MRAIREGLGRRLTVTVGSDVVSRSQSADRSGYLSTWRTRIVLVLGFGFGVCLAVAPDALGDSTADKAIWLAIGPILVATIFYGGVAVTAAVAAGVAAVLPLGVVDYPGFTALALVVVFVTGAMACWMADPARTRAGALMAAGGAVAMIIVIAAWPDS